MVKRRKRKEEKKTYEQLSFFDLFATGVEENNSEYFGSQKSTGIYGTENEEPTRSGSFDNDERSNSTIRTDPQGNLQQISVEGQSDLSGKSELYGTDRSTGKRNDVSVDRETTLVSIQENDHFYLIDEYEKKLSIKNKYEQNIKAIELLNQLKRENRTANAYEKTILAGYTGWGGASQVFDENNEKWQSQREYLKSIISIKEYSNAKASTLTSFFTPYTIIDNIYRIIDRLGFKSGNILEPSCGTGNFIGRMPMEMSGESYVCGVELDTITGSISKYLYDHNDIYIGGFEDTAFPDNTFDLAITNVPFGNFKVYDQKYHKLNYNIHNYFIAKTLDLIHDGGIIAFITSTDTLDGKSSIREYINERADFLGAVRLPSNTFYINGANTSVSSDIIFLQKNSQKTADRENDFLFTEKIDSSFHRSINRYFISNPQMVFGKISERKNQFGTYEIEVIDDSNIDNPTERFKHLFNQIMYKFKNVYYKNEIEEAKTVNLDIKETNKYPLNTYFTVNNRIYFKEPDQIIPIDDLSEKNTRRLNLMIKIADATTELINAQLDNVEEHIYTEKRKNLNLVYDSFVRQFGYIFQPSNCRLFKNDSRFSLIRALEIVDDQTKTAKKERIFFEKTIKPNKEIKHVDTIEEAVNASYNVYRKIDLDYMSAIYNQNNEIIKKELLEKKLAFEDPVTKEIIGANDYLSGHIRKKIEIARHYNYEENVKALNLVLPPTIEAEDINVQLGATWIDDEIIHDFTENLFKPPFYRSFNINYDKLLGEWIIEKYPTYNDPEIDNTWNVNTTDEKWIIGTDGKQHEITQPQYNGWNLLENVLNSKTPEIYNYWTEVNDDKETRKRKLNIERTTYARNLAEELQEVFKDWIFKDAERREYLVEKYNYLFNSIRLKQYDGSYLTFPEMNRSIILEDYQKNAIARIIDSKNTLLSQRVGAGKTFEMIAAGMKMKKMGLKNKLLYVVPNHLVNQWGEDFIKLYPNANILVADKKDFIKEKRQLFIHKIATSNYDAIIMAHSSFGLIPMSEEYQLNAMYKEIDTLQMSIDQLESSYDSSQRKRVKQLEKAKKSIENNIKVLVETKHRDDGITFDMLGIDYMFVDEAHEFKNLYIYSARSNIAGIPSAKSKKATDMLLKCNYIQENGGNVCFATGTPISNTMAELYILQKYLQNDELENMGIYCFDAWAKNFGEVVTSFEISIDGKGFTSKDRFCKFYNIQELMSVFKNIAEIQTESMLNEALKNSKTGRKYAIPPAHIGNMPQVIVIEPTESLKRYIDNIVERAEAVHNGSVNRSIDNMLKITTDSKKASIDLRLIDETFYPEHNTKLEIIADKISEIYFEYNNDKATQLVFCDSSTPNKNKFNVYDELKRLMILRDIPEEQIAFIHDYESMAAKQKLFKRVNKGEIRILIGSTAKLGAGTNVQERLIAVHHVDVPWRASDIEQRNGRAFRQGNRYKEIYEFRYVTKQSFDAYSWQMIETKASYQSQLFEGTTSAREIEEDNKAFFSYGEIKAIASGNPLIKRKFEIDNEIKKLEALQKQWQKKFYSAQNYIVETPAKIDYLTKKIPYYENDLKLANLSSYTIENLNNHFSITLFGKNYNDMKESNKILEDYLNNTNQNNVKVGTFAGFDINMKYELNDGWVVYIKAENEYRIDTFNRIGRVNIERIIRKINSIHNTVNTMKTKINNLQENLNLAHELINQGFPEKEQLKSLKTEQREINSILTNTKEETIQQEEILEY
ncbi:DEAD/DEAH box helicase family protein [[Clostridium] spiroforme]|nr:DEAD/DEAH box helicase family protein [Thomasclavelia spiroformis]